MEKVSKEYALKLPVLLPMHISSSSICSVSLPKIFSDIIYVGKHTEVSLDISKFFISNGTFCSEQLDPRQVLSVKISSALGFRCYLLMMEEINLPFKTVLLSSSSLTTLLN